MYEVYKWLLYRGGPQLALVALERMRRTLLVVDGDFEAACSLVGSLATWRGSLEDATVAALALKLEVPVWTLNDRDFSLFARLNFWSPASS